MPSYEVTALDDVALSVEVAKEAPLERIRLRKGKTAVVLRVLRIITSERGSSIAYVTHPEEVGASVTVNGLIEIKRVT